MAIWWNPNGYARGTPEAREALMQANQQRAAELQALQQELGLSSGLQNSSRNGTPLSSLNQLSEAYNQQFNSGRFTGSFRDYVMQQASGQPSTGEFAGQQGVPPSGALLGSEPSPTFTISPDRGIPPYVEPSGPTPGGREYSPGVPPPEGLIGSDGPQPVRADPGDRTRGGLLGSTTPAMPPETGPMPPPGYVAPPGLAPPGYTRPGLPISAPPTPGGNGGGGLPVSPQLPPGSPPPTNVLPPRFTDPGFGQGPPRPPVRPPGTIPPPRDATPNPPPPPDTPYQPEPIPRLPTPGSGNPGGPGMPGQQQGGPWSSWGYVQGPNGEMIPLMLNQGMNPMQMQGAPGASGLLADGGLLTGGSAPGRGLLG